MHSTKSEVFVVASLLFLIAVLIYGPITLHPVFAAAPAYCFEHDCPTRTCDNNIKQGVASCCWRDFGELKCQTCHVDTTTGDFYDCSDLNPTAPGGPPSGVIAPPPSGVAPPPSTQTCPANTALDANGNCAPITQAPTDQGTTLPPTNDNTDTKHHKGSNLGQLGGSLLNSDNNPPPSGDNNNKPSKHHKGSDTLTSPPLIDQGTP